MNQHDAHIKKINILLCLGMAAVAVILLLASTQPKARPISSTELSSPDIQNSNVMCKRFVINRSSSTTLPFPNHPDVMNASTGYPSVPSPTSSPWLPKCPFGQVPIGIYTGSIAAPNQYTNNQSKTIFNAGVVKTTLYAESMITDVTGWGTAKIYFANDVTGDTEQTNAQFRYRKYNGYQSNSNPINKVRLICAPRQFVFQSGPCP